MSEYVKSINLKHIVVPQKWLYELPKRFSSSSKRSYLLIAEKIDICSKKENKANFFKIDKEVLNELCIVLYKFRGLDSILDNHTFTYTNKIAFIDLDKWEEDRPLFLRKIRFVLSPEMLEYARQIFLELQRKEREASGGTVSSVVSF